MKSDTTSAVPYPQKIGYLALILMLGLCHYYLAAQGKLAGLLTDEVTYLYMADYFRGLRDEVTLFQMQSSWYPPVYPWLLSLLNGGSHHIENAHLVTSLCYTFSLLALSLFFSRTISNYQQRLLLSLIYVMAPGVLLWSIENLSENIYIAFVLFALYFYSHDDKKHYRYLFAIFTGMSIISRTIGIALLLAFLTIAILRVMMVFIMRSSTVKSLKQFQRFLIDHNHPLASIPRKINEPPVILMIVIMLLPSAIWEVIKIFIEVKPNYFNTILPIYQNWGNFYPILVDNLQRYWSAWFNFLVLENHYPRFIFIVLLVICFIGWLHRLFLARIDAIYLLFYFAILLVQPQPAQAERYLYPVAFLLLFYILNGIYFILPNNSKRVHNFAIYTPLFILLALAASGTTAITQHITVEKHRLPLTLQPLVHSRYWLSLPANLSFTERARQLYLLNQLLINIQEAAQRIPKGECVYSVLHQLTMLYGRRMAHKTITPDAQYFSQTGYCPYFLLTVPSLPHYPALYPYDYLKDKAELVYLSYLNQEQLQPFVMLIKYDTRQWGVRSCIDPSACPQ